MIIDRERIVRGFFFGFLILVGYLLYTILAPFLVPIGWAVLLSFLAFPLLNALGRFIRRRSLAALVITLLMLLGVMLPAMWLSTRLAVQAQALYKELAQNLAKPGSLGAISDWLRHSELGRLVNVWLTRYGIKFEGGLSKLTVEGARLTSSYVITHVASVALNVVGLLIDFSIILFTFYYLLRDGDVYYKALLDLTPLHEEDKRMVFETLGATLSAVMHGLMLTALLQGVSVGLGLVVVGIPYWVFLGALAAVLGLLPVGGAALVWVPAVIYLGFADGWGWAIGLLIWCLITQTVIDNIVKPALMRHGTGMPTIAMFFGVLGGLEAFGPIGLFAGPAIIALFAALLRVFGKTYGGEAEPG